MADRDIRKTVLAVLSMALITGCTASPSAESGIVSADAKHVVIKAGDDETARKMATAHCANYESNPVLAKRSENPSGTDQTRTYTFECR